MNTVQRLIWERKVGMLKRRPVRPRDRRYLIPLPDDYVAFDLLHGERGVWMLHSRDWQLRTTYGEHESRHEAQRRIEIQSNPRIVAEFNEYMRKRKERLDALEREGVRWAEAQVKAKAWKKAMLKAKYEENP